MFNSKSLFAAAFASLALLNAVPSVDARPGPVNPFSHPVQAFRWTADQHVGEAKTSIQEASLRGAFSVMNPSKFSTTTTPGDPMAIGATSLAQIDSIVSGFTSVINAEASTLTEELIAAGDTDLVDAVEDARADAIADLESAGATGKARIAAAMKKCSGPAKPKAGSGLDTQPRSNVNGTHGTTNNVGDAQ